MAAHEVICPHCNARCETVSAESATTMRCAACGKEFSFDKSLPRVSEGTTILNPPSSTLHPQSSGRGRSFPTEDAVPPVWEVGDVILDLYEVKQIHDTGGLGLVYRVHHRNWNVDLAVKTPRPQFFQTEPHKELFERE